MKNEETEVLRKTLLQKQNVNTQNPRKHIKNKAQRGGASIRVDAVPWCGVGDTLGEQETASATSREGWS